MNLRKKSRALSIVMTLIISLSTLSGCTFNSGQHSSDAVIIGVFEPMTGELQSKAAEEIKGIEIANELYPEVFGRNIELEFQDNASTITGAETAAVNLVKSGCSIVIGSYGSTLSIAGGSIFKEAKLPVIAATATNPLVTSGNDYYFRSCFVDTYQGITMAKFAYENLGVKKAFVIYNQDDDFGATVGDVFATKLKDLISAGEVNGTADNVNGNVTIDDAAVAMAATDGESDAQAQPTPSAVTSDGGLTEDNTVTSGDETGKNDEKEPAVVTARYTTNQEDFTNMLSTIKASNPDVIFIPSSVSESNKLIRQIRDMGYQGKFLGTNVWKDATLVSSMGQYAEGLIFPVLYDQTVQYNEKGQQFIDAYNAKYGYTEEIPEAAALGFDAYLLAVNSISKAGTTKDGTQIMEKLKNTQEYYGVTGSITFMWENDPIKSVVLRTVENGAIVYYDKMQPTFTAIEDSEELN